MTTTHESFDAFICVHRRDVNYLLGSVLRSYQLNFVPKARLMMITNDLPYLREFVDRLEIGDQIVLFSDSDWLSQQEQELPGWYKQQIIKLRSYEFCATAIFCNLGADTLLLQPITESDLVNNGFPVLYYTPHLFPDNHFRYEQERVRNVARLLKVEPERALKYVDFINDLFCFNKDSLVALNKTLSQSFGPNYYYSMLNGLKSVQADQNKFGEWTLYSVFVLDCLKREVMLRRTSAGFLHQIHSQRWLPLFQFNTKVAHFVGKNYDVDYIKRRIQNRGLELAKHL